MPSDNPKYLPSTPLEAIGSSYLVRLVAGSEQVGGLTVTLRSLDGKEGKLRTEVTDWLTDEPHEDANEMGVYVDSALVGVRSTIEELDLECGNFDTILHRFIYHPVNSHPRVYFQAGRSAFRSALEALRGCDVLAQEQGRH